MVYRSKNFLSDRLLGQQLKALWTAKANGQANNGTGQGEHYCEEHQAEFKRYEKDGRVWYSHKTADGKWCKEQ